MYVLAPQLCSSSSDVSSPQSVAMPPKKRKAAPAPFVPTGPSYIASLPTELLHVIFEEVVRSCENAPQLYKVLRRLSLVCRAWKERVAGVPLPPIVVTKLPQAKGLCALFEKGRLAGDSLKSLALSPDNPLHLKNASYNIGLTQLCATLLALCPNVVELALTVQPARAHEKPVFATEFLQSPALPKLRKLTITLPGSYHDPRSVVPLLSACRDLSTLIVRASFFPDSQTATGSEASPSIGPKPDYCLTTFELHPHGEWILDPNRATSSFIAYAIGRTTQLVRLVVGDSGLVEDVLRLCPETAASLEEVEGPLPVGVALPSLKRCIITQGIDLEELQRVAASAATGLSLSSSLAFDRDPSLWYGILYEDEVFDTYGSYGPQWPSKTLAPFLKSGEAASIKTLRVEREPGNRGRTLAKGLEEACVAQGIEIIFVPQL